MASITRRNGSYRVRIYRGNNKSICKSFSSESEARTWLKMTQAQLDLGIYIEPTSKCLPCLLNFKDAAEQYMSTHSIHKRNFVSEKGIFKILIKRWNDLTVHQINKQSVLTLRDELLALGRSHGTINHYFNAISKLYQMLINERDIEVANPIMGIKRMPLPQGRTKRVYGDIEERLLAACNQLSLPLLSLIITFAIETGMRRGEIMGLQWSDIDLTKRRVFLHQTKNGDPRQIPLSGRAITVLEALNKDGYETVFPMSLESLRNQYVKVRNHCMSQWSGAGKNPFEDLRFHDLRHEALSRLSDLGLNVIELSCISGHRTLGMLRRYTHPSHTAILNKLDGKTA